MKRRRILTVLLAMLLAVVSLQAKEIRIEGMGTTPEEAVLNAQDKLASYFSVEIKNETTSKTVDDGTSSSSTFTENIRHSTDYQIFLVLIVLYLTFQVYLLLLILLLFLLN